ncbi:YeeE/YedE family protein [Actibacterium mucosum]|nr:YeeE/YedE family protein [Actibacterium mucosum]
MEGLIDQFGEGRLMLATGAFVGIVFGFAAYRSNFCLRAATVEVAEGHVGARLAVWLIAFFTGLTSVQLAVAAGLLDVSDARQLANTGSLSGAVLGGLMFGSGMVLARGCASRLLVLSASGNLRAIVTGLVLTLVAQASLRGALAPLREDLTALWTIKGGTARYLVSPDTAATPWLVMALFGLLGSSIVFGLKQKAKPADLLFASLVGLTIFAGWQLTYLIAQSSFEIVAIQSITFTGPSTDTLMAFVNARTVPPSFGLGLVPGVFGGAMLAAIMRGEARIQRFELDVPMERYLLGGALMGFGSMLAGGCAVGAGLTGGAVLSLTAWLAVFCMWIGAVATYRGLQKGLPRQTA